jgi:hypothetical protein
VPDAEGEAPEDGKEAADSNDDAQNLSGTAGEPADTVDTQTEAPLKETEFEGGSSGSKEESEISGDKTTENDKASATLTLHPKKGKTVGTVKVKQDEDGTWVIDSEEYYNPKMRMILMIAIGLFAAAVLFSGSFVAYVLIRRRRE